MEEKKVEIKDFIGIYDNYVTDFECDKIIKLFEAQANFKKTFTREATEKASIFAKKDAQLFCNVNNIDVYLEEIKTAIINFDLALKHYESSTGIKEAHFGSLNQDFEYTTFKIQKTLPSEGYHIWHIEHGSNDMGGRALAWLIYLNDVDEGGETEFLHQKIRVKPKKGRVVIWPAGFPYVHRGNPPISNEKYILTSWMMLP